MTKRTNNNRMNGHVASEKNNIGSCVNKPGGGSNLYIPIVHVQSDILLSIV